jgi:hypothetical protein
LPEFAFFVLSISRSRVKYFKKYLLLISFFLSALYLFLEPDGFFPFLSHCTLSASDADWPLQLKDGQSILRWKNEVERRGMDGRAGWREETLMEE